MESNKNLTDQGKMTGSSVQKPSASTGSSGYTPGGRTEQTGHTTGSAPQRAREIASEVGGGVKEAYEQTAKAVEGAYEKTSEVLSNTYNQTMTYGRENPGKLTLIAFGAGIGIGVLLASGFGGRRRASRFAEPVVNALSQVALEFFR